tara:strand:- start:8335 stop:9018 length:684 start_codon:yes stop_codon:yes gene_type:complete
MLKYLNIIFIAIIFFLGLYYYTFYNKIDNLTEGMENKKHCYDMLIEHSGKIYLFNKKNEIKKDTNPIIFNNLEEYKKYVQEENSKGNKCPVLFLKYTTNAQNEELLQVKKSIFENNGGDQFKYKDKRYYEENKMLDATKNSTPGKNKIFNKNMYSGFDKDNQNIGSDTPLDRIFNSNSEISSNPMDTNWGGKKYTQDKIKQGEYKDREVYKYNNTINFNNKIKQKQQ